MLFNLMDLHVQHRGAAAMVGVRIIDAESLEKAKQFIRACCPGTWAIVEKKTFDRGIVCAEKQITGGGIL